MNKRKIETRHGEIKLPAFLPDATYGTIRNLSFNDLENTGIKEVVTTTLHLEQTLGSLYIKKMGGIHKFINWNRPVLTDSGGWQVYSLINSKNANKKNKITEMGCSFIDPKNGNYNLLTPEASIIIQSNLGSDIFTVLDDPIIGDASLGDRKESVDITTKWAARGKKQFSKIYSKSINRPLIGAVIQGANDFKMRKISAESLIKIGFDLFNFGGIPVYEGATWKADEKKGFYREMLEYVSDLIPKDKYKYAMGIGQPDDIAFCVEIGWDLFDTVLPTRNARHGYLYVSEGSGDITKDFKGKIFQMSYDVMHLRSSRYKFDETPVDLNCSCECCLRVSRSYLRHLIRIKEPAGFRLATIHNLSFYSNWMKNLRKEIGHL